MNAIRVASSGGGVQSTAMLVLSAQREIDFPLHLFSNVGDDSEHPATLEYVREVAMPYAAKHGIEFVELRSRPRGTERTLYQKLTDPDGRSVGIPVRMASGAPGRRQCTADYKIRRIASHLKQRGASAENPAVVALGISIDEFQRMRTESGIAWETLAYPLIDLRLDRAGCVGLIERAGLPVPPKSSCWFCLAGDTEVVTRDGIIPIRALAGTTADILVPIQGVRGGISEVGSFKPTPVHSFGTQRLYAVNIRRTKTTKTIYATAEHRWLLAPKAQWAPIEDSWRTTSTLKAGDRLRSLRATPLAKEKPLPFAVAQGFVFGDGTKGEGDRPASLNIHAGKDEALLPLFAICQPRQTVNHFGKPLWFVYGLPRTWKSLPDIRESRSFLLGWLAGWFAADGHIAPGGPATLYAANCAHLEYARSVFGILGVQTTPIRRRMRNGFGASAPLASLNFNARDVFTEFFILEHHRERATEIEGRASHDNHWVVESIALTDRDEEVFCATVEGVGAFGLADGLMTGNCPFHSLDTWRKQKRDEPELFAKSVALERTINEKRAMFGKGDVWLTDALRPLDEAVGDHDQLDLFESPSCDIAGFCHS